MAKLARRPSTVKKLPAEVRRTVREVAAACREGRAAAAARERELAGHLADLRALFAGARDCRRTAEELEDLAAAGQVFLGRLSRLAGDYRFCAGNLRTCVGDVTTGLRDPPDHRNHRDPGTTPMILRRFSARADSA